MRSFRIVGVLAGLLLLLLCGAAVAADEIIEAWTMPVLARHALEGGHTMTVYEDPGVGVLCYVLDRDKAMACVPVGATHYVAEIK